MNWPLVSRTIRHSPFQLAHRARPSAFPPLQWLRRYSTSHATHPARDRKDKRTTWAVLAAVGGGTLAYACYAAYNWRTLYPEEVRGDLKRGIAAKHSGDLERSEYYKRKAWNTTIRLPIADFKADPLPKIAGIAIDLAGDLEARGKFREAFTLCSDAFDLLRESPGLLRERDRLLPIGLAVKLGKLAELCELPHKEEQFRIWAVEEVLRLVRDVQGNSSTGAAPAQPLDVGGNLKLPPWMSKDDISVPLSELAHFYARAGNLAYATPLYLRAYFLMVSDDNNAVPPEELCQGATMLNNLAELIIRQEPSDLGHQSAESWAQKALSILKDAREKTKEPISICEYALSVALFNAGMLRELVGDEKGARAYFTSALVQSKRSGFREGATEAKEALARLNTSE